MNTETKTKIDELIARLGISMKCTQPTFEREETGKPSSWHHLKFMVAINRERETKYGKDHSPVWDGPYRMGLGNFPEFKGIIGRNLTVHAEEEIKASVANRNPRRPLRTRPALPDVLHSLLSDGSAFFDAASFEEWAGEYGYDSDSRMAEQMYQKCRETGRKLSRAFTAAEIQELREAFQDY